MRPAQEFTHSLAELVTMPEVYRGFRRLLAKPDSKIIDYAAVINKDPALATRFIRIANSAFFGYIRKVDTLEQAVTLIGAMQVHDVLISSLAMRAFSGIPKEIVNLTEFWESSVYCGIMSRLIAKKCMLPASERFFTLGLFHDIGHIVMYAKRPKLARDVLIQSLVQDHPLYRVEREMFGFDYGEVGAELLNLWHLPQYYQETTQYHPEPQKAQHYPLETAIVHLAYKITQAEYGSIGASEKSMLVSPLAWKLSKLKENDIKPIRIKAKENVEEVLTALWPLAEPPYERDSVKQSLLNLEGY